MEAATKTGIEEFVARKQAEQKHNIYFANLSKEVEQAKQKRIASDISNSESPKFHYWANSKSGIVLSGSKYNPCKKGKSVYLGFSNQAGWPKKMNTGRIIYTDPHGSPAARAKKNKKENCNL